MAEPAHRSLDTLHLDVESIAGLLMTLGEPAGSTDNEHLSWLGGKLADVAKELDQLRVIGRVVEVSS